MPLKKLTTIGIIYVITFGIIFILICFPIIFLSLVSDINGLPRILMPFMAGGFFLGLILLSNYYVFFSLIFLFLITSVLLIIYYFNQGIKKYLSHVIIIVGIVCISVASFFLSAHKGFEPENFFDSVPAKYQLQSLNVNGVVSSWLFTLGSYYEKKQYDHQVVTFLPDKKFLYSRANYNCSAQDTTYSLNQACQEAWYIYSPETEETQKIEYPSSKEFNKLILSGIAINGSKLYFNDNKVVYDTDSGDFQILEKSADEALVVIRELVDFVDNQGSWCLDLKSEKSFCSEGAMFIHQVIVTEDESQVAFIYDDIYGPSAIFLYKKN